MEGGSKTIERVRAVLAVLEKGPADGMTSGQIAVATGFDKATAHRALVSLERTGLLDRDVETRRYRLGVYLFSLGASVARRFSILSQARDVIRQIAVETGDTVYLSVRNNFDSVCIDSATGAYPLKAQTLTIGESVPLGVSAGGVAMLATMSEEEVRHALQFNAVAITAFRRVRPEEIYAHVQAAREQGFARYAGHVVAGMGAVARAIRDHTGKGVAVISVTALIDRLSDHRSAWIADLIAEGVRSIEERSNILKSYGAAPEET